MTGKPQDTDAVLEAQYNNRALVPDHPAVMARWKAESEAARAAHPPQVLKYSPGERERIDWFDAGDGAPVVVFLHGGYWQALDASWFSFVAPPLLAHGVSKGARVREVGIHYHQRGAGRSKNRIFKYGWAFLRCLWRLRREARRRDKTVKPA